MKILIVEDYKLWAIGKLTDLIVKYNPHLNIEVLEIHPKEYRANPDKFNAYFLEKVKQFQPDMIHFQYWDLANSLGRLEQIKDIPKILTHHNQKNLLSHEWEHLKSIVVHTQKAKKILEEKNYWNVDVIQHGIEIEKFKFNDNYDVNNNLLGYVGRICRWKGLRDILKAASELGTEVIMMGRMDKPDYWKECVQYDEQMDNRLGTPDDQQVGVYHEMGIYVGNSDDGIEEGTLGLLEAMACGIPVVTTPSGEAADIIKDGENGVIVDFQNYESLRAGIERMMKADKNKIRENAWNTVKNMSAEVMARNYEKLYYRTVFEKDLVSVIIPTFNRADTICKILDGYKDQTYKPIEIIVVDDNSNDETQSVIADYRRQNCDMTIKYLNTGYDGYGLAMARNMGIFEATGNYLIFSDDRFLPEQTAVEAFVNNIKQVKESSAIWGDKGAGRRDFIENFFIIRKKDISNAGMFNERLNEYGGQSQEIRERFRRLGYKLNFEPAARCEPLFGTKNKSKKRYEVFRMKTKLWKLRS